MPFSRLSREGRRGGVSQMVPGTETEPRAVRTTRGVEAFGRENARFEPTVYRVCQFEVFSKARGARVERHGYDVALVAQVRKSHAVRIQRKNMKRWYYPKRRKGESAPNKKDWLREKRWAVDGEWLHARSSGGLLDTNLGEKKSTPEKKRKVPEDNEDEGEDALSLVPGAVLESPLPRKEEEVEVEVEEEERGYHSSAVSESSVGSGAYGRRTLLHAVKAERVCMKQLESLGFVTVVTA